jgi:hypothetical protein
MGLSMLVGEVKGQMAAMDAALDGKRNAALACLAQVEAFCGEMSLTGEAWAALKAYFHFVHAPWAKGIAALCEEVKAANKLFLDRFASEVDASGRDIIEDEIQVQLDELNALVRSIAEAGLDSGEDMLHLVLRLAATLEEVIHKLHAFDVSSAMIYDHVAELADAVASCAGYLGSGYDAKAKQLTVPLLGSRS